LIRLFSSILTILFLMPVAHAFPLDAAAQTGIERLEGYRLAQQEKVRGNKLPAGAQLAQHQIILRLEGLHVDPLSLYDSRLTQRIIRLLGKEADNYSISVLDLSDPEHLRYAEHNAEQRRNPGSVGKLIVALALFQALADIYPDDIAARERVLRESMIVADEFIQWDHHVVPFWFPEQMRLRKRRLAVGDAANYWSYLDWMMSASSNAAASMVFKHVLLLRHFGKAYPVTPAEEEDYFSQSRGQLRQNLLAALQGPVSYNGLNLDNLRQGGFFSREGKRRVPGDSSVSTTRELMRYLLLMEQGKLVDAWSSLQIKRLLYITQRRIRYASAPALRDAAIYFKSGSFYKCRPEEGFICRKYSGNVLNLMNSVAIVESPAGSPELNYMVTITSNVLRKNSAVAHQTLATRLHALIRSLHPVRASQQ